MPRYFFHVDDGEFLPDPIGTELPDIEAAPIEAVRSSGAMINEIGKKFWAHTAPWNMHVTDDAHRLQFTLQFSAKVPAGEMILTPGAGPAPKLT